MGTSDPNNQNSTDGVRKLIGPGVRGILSNFGFRRVEYGRIADQCSYSYIRVIRGKGVLRAEIYRRY